MVRAAFTLIELIFAIIVIGISIISLPTMNQATTKGLEGNMVQEAIFAASTELNQVITANWDDNSLEPGSENSTARVIDIFTGTGRCDTNSTSATYRQMAGHINQKLHRRCLDSNLTVPSDSNTTVVIGLDEMGSNTTYNLFSNSDTDAEGYKNQYTAKITVTRPADFNGSNPNMKSVAVRVYDADDELIVKLTTYSANIGEIDYYKRSY